MKSRNWLLLVGSLLSLIVVRVSTQAPRTQPVAANGLTVARGEVLVKFRTPPTDTDLELVRSQIDADRDRPIGGAGVRWFHSRSLDQTTLLTFFHSHPGVLYAEPNFIVQSTLVPNDPGFSQLWAMLNSAQPGADIGAVAAWNVSTGSSAAVVAVIDTGLDYTHQDLAANVWSAPTSFSVTVGGVSITCPAGSHGFNALAMTCNPMDDNNHGTHVSGTIGAVGNNDIGVVGVNWTTRILGAKFLDSTGSGSISDAINAIDFVIKVKHAFSATSGANVRVLSNSWGGAGFSQALLDEINLANANDMLFVAAAGNNGSDNDVTSFYPAGFTAPNVIAVAATDSTDQLASWSDYGASSVHLAAPGVGIVSTTIGNTYATMSGTSMATPHVAGAAALVLSECSLDTAGVKNVLLTSVDVLSALVGRTITGGRLNVNTAIRNCGSTSPPPPPAPALPSTPTNLVASAGNATISLAWTASSGASTYNVQRGTGPGGETLLASGVSSTNYVDGTAANGVTYYYVVSAVNAAGTSAHSNEVSATPVAPPPVTIPAAPTGLVASTGPGTKKVSLKWNVASGATSYSVLRGTASGGPYAPIASGVTTTTYTNAGLTGRQMYFYVVTATNSAGTSGDSNQASAAAK